MKSNDKNLCFLDRDFFVLRVADPKRSIKQKAYGVPFKAERKETPQKGTKFAGMPAVL